VQRNPFFSRAGLPGFTGRGPGSTPVAIANRANTTVVPLAGGAYTVEKTAGVNGTYDASAVSALGLAGSFTLRLRNLVAGDKMAGMNTDPLTDDSYVSLDRAWQSAAGLWAVYESSNQRIGGLADATYAWIWRRSGIVYYGRGVALPSVGSADWSAADASTLFFDCSLRDTNAKFEILLVTP
jgi:hypothetical protein